MSISVNSSLPNGKMFLVTSSQLHERYDPYYIFHKLNTSLESQYQTERLSSLVNTFSGGTPSKSNPSYWDGNIPWISPKDFNGFNLFETQDKISEEGVKNSSTKVAPKNSIVIVVRSGVLAHTFPVCINRVPAAINQDLKVLTPTTEKLLPEFLGYYFFTFGEDLLPLITKHGTTVHSINTEQFERLQIPVPPIGIQEKVISIYQEHFEAKAQKEAEAEELLSSIDDYLLSELGIEVPKKDNSLENRIFKTSFQQVSGARFDAHFSLPFYEKLLENLGNSNCTLKNLESISSKISRSFNPEKNKKYEYIQLGSIGRNSTVINDQRKIALPNIPSRAQHVVHSGEILFSQANPQWGVHILIADEFDKCPVSSGFTILKPTEINSYYLTEILRSSFYCELYNKYLTGAGLFLTISQTDLMKIKIPVPPIEKQNEIADHIHQLREQTKSLKEEAEQAVEEARRQVAEMILKEDSVPA